MHIVHPTCGLVGVRKVGAKGCGIGLIAGNRLLISHGRRIAASEVMITRQKHLRHGILRVNSNEIAQVRVACEITFLRGYRREIRRFGFAGV